MRIRDLNKNLKMPPATPQQEQGATLAHSKLSATKDGASDPQFSLSVSLSQNARVQINAQGLGLGADAVRGFHIHAFGDMSSDNGMAMGGHLNPFGQPHACPDGDRVSSNTQFGLQIKKIRQQLTHQIAQGFLLGRGFILHSQPDDCTTQPTGNAGSRLAQGVITYSHTAKLDDKSKFEKVSKDHAISVFNAHVTGSIVASRADLADPLVLNFKLSSLEPSKTYKLGLGLFEYDTNNKFATKTDCANAVTSFTVDASGSISCSIPIRDSDIPFQSLFGQSFILMDASSNCHKVPIIAAAPIGVKDALTTVQLDTCKASIVPMTPVNFLSGVEGSELYALGAVMIALVGFLVLSAFRKGSGYAKVGEVGKAD
ncbi:superoxide dismutase [Chytriomyces cf. hyalinus JEL632]|nr:superoxide dismutase [Chytriomyces cf. hyalinus JEL632]